MNEEPIPSVPPVVPTPDLPAPPAAPAEDASVKLVTSGSASPGAPQAGNFAPLGTRIVAALIDVMVAIGLQIVISWILPHFAARIAWLVGLAYLVTRDSLPFLGGQSVGKKAMKLQAVTLDGKSLIGNWESALIRNAVLAIPLFPLVELVVLLIRKDKPEHDRRLGDEWAKTQVILAPDPTPAG
jgi:uncharacterized RDD family membrane protein YckC